MSTHPPPRHPAAAFWSFWIFCELPYPGRTEAHRRHLARKRAERLAEAMLDAEEQRRNAVEREAKRLQQLKSRVGPNVAWGGSPTRRIAF